MFTTETGIGVVVMVVFAVFWLAFMLWEDWGQAGKTARARASAKANGWEQDEMQNTITRNGAIIAYRLMTVGLFVVMLVDIIAFGKNVSEFAILWFVCMVFEGVYRTIATYRAAKDGDQVNIDFDGSIDGEAWDSDTDYDLVIGSEDFQPEFEEHLIGAKAGDTLEFTITLSDDYDGDYAGKDADFKVTVNAVQEINVPELNDDYCKKYTDYDTVDEYRAGVRKDLEEYYDETNTETAQNDLLSQILENSKVSGYPQDLYDKCKEEYDANNQILADRFGIDVSDIASSEDNVKSAVEEMVYTEMLTTAIAEKENITVSDDEYTDYVNSVYEESGYTSAEEYEEDYTKDETVNTILYNKVMDFLMQNATVTEVSEDEYYEEDTEMDEEAYDTEEITENETDAEDLEMTE